MNASFQSYLNNLGYDYKIFDEKFLFFNKLNGDVFEADFDYVKKFEKEKFIKRKNTNAFLDLQKLFEEKHEVSKEVSKEPFHIQWHINDICNLRCKHCYIDDYAHKGLDFVHLKKIVDDYFVAIKKWKNLPEFSITGGEPLLNKNLFPLLQYIKKKDKKTRISILTNGTLINNSIIKKLKLVGVNSIQISLEASNAKVHDSIRGKGNYKKVISKIKLLKKNNFRVSLHFVLSKQNVLEVIPYIKKARELKVNLITISLLVPFGNGKQMKDLMLSPKELKQTFEKIDDFVKENKIDPFFVRRTRPIWCNFNESDDIPVGGNCPVAFSTLTILSNGEVMPCRRFPKVIGDLKKQNFFEIWYGSNVLWDLRKPKNIDGCGNCSKLDKCGGCRGLAYVYFGDYMAPDPQCWLINNNLGDYYKINK